MSHGECSAEATACLVAITNSITDTMSKLEAIGSMTEHAAGLTVMGSNEIDEKIAEAFYEDPTTPAKAVVRKLETEEVFPTDENELFESAVGATQLLRARSDHQRLQHATPSSMLARRALWLSSNGLSFVIPVNPTTCLRRKEGTRRVPIEAFT